MAYETFNTLGTSSLNPCDTEKRSPIASGPNNQSSPSPRVMSPVLVAIPGGSERLGGRSCETVKAVGRKHPFRSTGEQ